MARLQVLLLKLASCQDRYEEPFERIRIAYEMIAIYEKKNHCKICKRSFIKDVRLNTAFCLQLNNSTITYYQQYHPLFTL